MKEFYKLVKSASPEQRANLAKLTASGFGDSPGTLCNHIKFLRAGSIGQVFWDKPWKQVVTDVADHVGIDWQATLQDRRWQQLPTQEIEDAIVAKLFQDMLMQASPEQREDLVLAMKRDSDDPHIEVLLATGGATDMNDGRHSIYVKVSYLKS
ncbi:MAG: hypothetical protein VKK04_09185 [Synechococcales bacterium]|nr:hypothetical protein [Synechococcales bacterium]